VLDVPEVDALCALSICWEAVEGGLRLLEVLVTEVLAVLEVMRCVQLCMLEVMRCMLSLCSRLWRVDSLCGR